MSHILDPLRELLQVQPEGDCASRCGSCLQAGYNRGLREALVLVGRELDRAVQEAEWVPPIPLEEALGEADYIRRREVEGILGGSRRVAREYMGLADEKGPDFSQCCAYHAEYAGSKVASDGFLEPTQYRPRPTAKAVGNVIRDAAGIKWVRREKQQPDGLLAVWWEVASE